MGYEEMKFPTHYLYMEDYRLVLAEGFKNMTLCVGSNLLKD